MKKIISITGIIAFISILAAHLSSPNFAGAQELRTEPGTYLTKGGWGSLSISKNKDGELAFEISSLGANAHSCGLKGTIKSGQAILKGSEEKKPCIVTFHLKGDKIEVTDNENACRSYCGARASFTGLYLKAKQGCSEIEKSRKAFKRLYDKKAYAQARDVLEPLLKNCEDVVDWMEIGWIRNDLAITEYKLGEYAECLRILRPLEAEAKKTDDELFDSYPGQPAYAESSIAIAKATRTNLKLCGQGGAKRQQ